MTSDLKIAKIYISFLEPKKTIDELMHILIDKKKLIRHYAGLQLKLRYIPDRMLTETGTKLALERAEFMHIFFEVLNKEVFG